MIVYKKKEDCPAALGAFFSSRKNTKMAVITDSNVERIYGNWLKKALEHLGVRVILLSFEAGENSKTRETKQLLEDRLIDLGFDARGLLVSFGGGVVSDIAGFIGATLFRGIDMISIPTTLMGMVDAAIGGKNGVNTQRGKNLIGSFYHPKEILICPEFLDTLSQKELLQGSMEICKYGLIWQNEIFYGLVKGESPCAFINRSLQIKEEIVERSKEDPEIRHILNFGHTFAHAIESYYNYQVSHGEALWAGLMIETFGSFKLGFLSEEKCEEIITHLKMYPFNLSVDTIEWNRLFSFMKGDKKNALGRVALVGISDVGTVKKVGESYLSHLTEAELLEIFIGAKKRVCHEVLH